MDLKLYEKYDYVPRQPIEVILNSQNGTELNNLDGHKIYLLEQEISARKDERILLYLKKAFIPFSFYTLSSSQKNNILDIKETQAGGATNTYPITIPDGNYNITELTSKIKTLLEANTTFGFKYSVSYDTSTGKVSFLLLSGTTPLNATLLFASGDNANFSVRNILGFNSTDVVFTLGTFATSQKVVDMADGLDSIHIKSNIVGDNIRSTNAEGGELLLVPVDLEPFSILYYDDGALPFKHLISQNNIKRIEIKMTDANDNVIDFNQIPYTLILQVEFIFNPSSSINVNNRQLEEQNSLKNMVKRNEELAREIIKKNNK
jgi:hypothetical protein